MDFTIRFSEEKNQLLKATRGIGFEEVVEALEGDNLLADIAHPGLKRVNQRLYVIRICDYAYAVPYVIDHGKRQIFLKTVYPSSKLTKRYIRIGE